MAPPSQVLFTSCLWIHLPFFISRLCGPDPSTPHLLSCHKLLDAFCSSISSVQLLSRVWLCNPMDCSNPGFLAHHRLLELAQTHVHWVSDAIQQSCPLLPPSPPAVNLSQHQGLFQWVSSSIRWPKYWSFSFSISPSNEYSGLFSLKIEWLDPPVVQGTLKSLLQHHSSKASILWCSAFFIVQLTYPYMTTGKTIALTRWTLLAK